jgi:lysophospholipid acyltransferase (LPLAT)-like uncharacterized protein
MKIEILSRLATWIIRLVYHTMRIEFRGREAVDRLIREGRHYIYAFWHGRLFLMPYAYFGERIAIMVSEHKDGQLIARTMEKMGFSTIRGSTTRGAMKVFRSAVLKVEEGFDLAVTPDGPRGPRYRVQGGVIHLAKVCGIPIVPVTFGARRKKVFKSWDAFMLPRPFGKGVFAFGDPLTVPADADKDGLEEIRKRLEQQLNDLTAQVDDHWT